MNYLLNNEQKINDIIFAHRNKNYGAYQIRSDYGNTVFKSIFIMLMGIASVIYVAYYFSRVDNIKKSPVIDGQLADLKKIYEIPIDLEPKKPKEIQTLETSKPKSSSPSQAISTLIKDSVSANTNTAINETTALMSKNTSSIDGSDGSADSKSLTIGNSKTATVTANKEPVIIPDSSPEFEGGLSALYAFLGSKLVYPEAARDGGIEGTVYVRFIVDEEGEVGGLSLQNKKGFG